MSALGALFEILQFLIPGRSPSVIDAVACSSGAAFGVLLGTLTSRLLSTNSE
jgi:VanZ family protein